MSWSQPYMVEIDSLMMFLSNVFFIDIDLLRVYYCSGLVDAMPLFACTC